MLLALTCTSCSSLVVLLTTIASYIYYRYGTEYTDLFDFVERLKYPLDGWRVPLTRAVRNPEVSALGMAFVNCIPWLNCTLIQSPMHAVTFLCVHEGDARGQQLFSCCLQMSFELNSSHDIVLHVRAILFLLFPSPPHALSCISLYTIMISA